MEISELIRDVEMPKGMNTRIVTALGQDGISTADQLVAFLTRVEVNKWDTSQPPKQVNPQEELLRMPNLGRKSFNVLWPLVKPLLDRPPPPTRNDTIRECAAIADTFTCGICGMDGKAGAAIRALLTDEANP